MLAVPQHSAAWRLSLLSEFQLDAVLPKLVNISTLLVAAERDRLLPSVMEVQFLERMLPKSRSIVLPNSGHACLLEKDVCLGDLLATRTHRSISG
jgi:pimeloyl-ACP methyl ester carboxylesterase